MVIVDQLLHYPSCILLECIALTHHKSPDIADILLQGPIPQRPYGMLRYGMCIYRYNNIAIRKDDWQALVRIQYDNNSGTGNWYHNYIRAKRTRYLILRIQANNDQLIMHAPIYYEHARLRIVTLRLKFPQSSCYLLILKKKKKDIFAAKLQRSNQSHHLDDLCKKNWPWS